MAPGCDLGSAMSNSFLMTALLVHIRLKSQSPALSMMTAVGILLDTADLLYFFFSLKHFTHFYSDKFSDLSALASDLRNCC